MMLHVMYESSNPYNLGQDGFYSFVFWLPWQPEFCMVFKFFKYSESASPKNHFCEGSLKSV